MMEKNSSSNQSLDLMIFPYHILKEPSTLHTYSRLTTQNDKGQCFFPSMNLLTSKIFQKVYAAEKDEMIKDGNDDESIQQMKYTQSLDVLAKVYIQQESGWDRVKTLFEKDHRGKSDMELDYIKVTLMQVFIITFFFKYIPVARFARKEFIRENQATVFRTRFEAIRRLQDHTFMKAAGEAASFSTKITLFSAAFLLFSSMISSYRNKTSVLEYTLAAGITGGLARVNMGLKGFIGGSVVGAFLGSAVGLLGYISLSAYGMTQEERHLESIKSKLEVFKSIEGESRFRDRVNRILAEDTTLSVPSS